MFFKFRVLRYIRSHGIVEEEQLKKKFGDISRLGRWCNDDPGYLFYYDAGRALDSAAYEITENGREYVGNVYFQIFLAFFGAFIGALLGAFLGVVRWLLPLIQSI